jgi:ATP-dependent helicase/nuclease subunit A
MTRSTPWDIANRDQARASDPDASVWVSAHAGSGKTHVLVNRVIRLMLAGVVPERILCLTYTRAAAAEMSRRLFDVLSSWIPLDDDALIERIHKISGFARFGGELKAARRLFARALETPGGLKIQTIHAFCERLLQRFPVEAGVVPGFTVMDEVEAREILSGVRRAVMAEARGSQGPAAAALAKVVAFAGDQQIDGLVKELLAKRSDLKRLLGDEALRDRAMEGLAGYLGVAGEVSQQTVWNSAVSGMDRARYSAAAAALLESGSKTDPKLGALLKDALAAADPEQVFATLKSVFLTQAGQPRASVCTRATAGRYPEVAEHLAAECDRVVALAEMERAVKIRDASAALFSFADQIVGRYEAEKRRLGRYDYDDLIGRTLSMFYELEHAAWVLYKLDGGLDHILIDEAQDTSPEQWQIVQFLAEEFFSGEGQRPGALRTVFAVGDRKQSIFSFQGADPDEFDAMRRYFRDKAAGARLAFETVRPAVSFRSTQTILDAVDAVFANAAAAQGVIEPGVSETLHQAVRQGPGLVEIWDPERPDASEDASPWQAGSARDSGAHPRLRLARRIAATIRGWLDSGEALSNGRPIRPGDVLILVRNRTTFMDALVRALKQEAIEVAGADRLVLTRHIAIEDLLALARFTLLPDDDLTLAAVLKSPLVARDDGAPLDDDDLFALAWDRGSDTLWARLHAAVADGAPYGTTLERLKRWRAASDFMPPYEFFSQVLTAEGGRRAIMNRLGTEAGEPLDAFLSLALEFAPGRAGALQTFLAAVEDSGAEIKRDMDQGANEVRVMTVHGAKGLEAPIVFLPDTCDPPSGRHDPAILFASDPATGKRIPVWRLKKALETSRTEVLRQAQQERERQEYNRLLYVAMTRARDRLYVGGCQMAAELKPNCWYDFIDTALRPLAQEIRTPDGHTVWRIEGGESVRPAEEESELEPPILSQPPPQWALRDAAPEPAAMHWLIASRIEDTATESGTAGAERVASPLAGTEEHRFRRGRLIHRLLQALPDLPPPARADAGRRYLDRAAGELAQLERQAVLDEALAILEEPSLASLFAPGSLAEVPLAAVLGAEANRFGLTGQIDRLAVSDDEVVIADYKTNRPPPASPEDTDPVYIRQLAAYAAALKRLYPGRTIRCVLVWTDGPRAMEIPAWLLDSALRLDEGRSA